MLMRASWTIASIFFFLSYSYVVSVPMDMGTSSSNLNPLKLGGAAQWHMGDSQHGQKAIVTYKSGQPPAKQTKTLSTNTRPISPGSNGSEDLLEALLEQTEGQGHLTSHSHHGGSPESHQEFTRWMESKFADGFNEVHVDRQKFHPSTRLLGTPSSSLSETEGRLHQLPSVKAPSLSASSRIHTAPLNSETGSSSPGAVGTSKPSKRGKRKKAERWHMMYDETQQERLRNYYSQVLEEYGWDAARHASLKNKFIRNTPIALRDRIANGKVIRHPDGGENIHNEVNLSLPSRRKPRWSIGLSEDEEVLVSRFGDRLMSHRAGKSPSVKNRLLSRLTPSEIEAIKTGNEAEKDRIEEAKMPRMRGTAKPPQ